MMFTGTTIVVFSVLLLLGPQRYITFTDSFAVGSTFSSTKSSSSSSLLSQRSSPQGDDDKQNNNYEKGHKRIGFIGCGTIASAIVKGIATQNEIQIESIAVSKRSQSKSLSLREEFPSLVQIYDDNQEILDCSDIIFVCVLPDQTIEVLKTLHFDIEKHSLVSLVVSCLFVNDKRK